MDCIGPGPCIAEPPPDRAIQGIGRGAQAVAGAGVAINIGRLTTVTHAAGC